MLASDCYQLTRRSSDYIVGVSARKVIVCMQQSRYADKETGPIRVGMTCTEYDNNMLPRGFVITKQCLTDWEGGLNLFDFSKLFLRFTYVLTNVYRLTDHFYSIFGKIMKDYQWKLIFMQLLCLICWKYLDLKLMRFLSEGRTFPAYAEPLLDRTPRLGIQQQFMQRLHYDITYRCIHYFIYTAIQ